MGAVPPVTVCARRRRGRPSRPRVRPGNAYQGRAGAHCTCYRLGLAHDDRRLYRSSHQPGSLRVLLMVRYAARAVPWVRVSLAAGLVVLLMELVRWDPWGLWPLEGTAVGLLPGAAAWCFDGSGGGVAEVAPRGLAWRTAARTPAVLVLTAVWCGVVAHAGDSALFGRSAEILIEGLVALAVGSAYASCRRAWGEPVPGLLLAT